MLSHTNSIWFAAILVILFIILLLFVWRQRERSFISPKYPYAREERDELQVMVPALEAEFEAVSNQDIIEEGKKVALLKQKEGCKSIDPVLSFYSREYANRWKQVKPHINAVGFTPITKRCAYPGAPCEWQDQVEDKDKYELLSGVE